MRVLVLGGAGFLGRHVAAGLGARGHAVLVGSRRRSRGRVTRFEVLLTPDAWASVLDGVDAVVNCVGILREHFATTYDRVHHRAPAALSRACAARGLRLVHVSALGLDDAARSSFIASKLDGEAAVRASGADYSIVRPSLLDGEGGFGARWVRALARLPLCVVPADAVGRIAMLDVNDAGHAIARLVELPGREYRDVGLGGVDLRTLAEHLAALRGDRRRAVVLRLPALAARLASHVCDALHFSPFSFGHLELLRRDNVPHPNLLPALLGAHPRRIGDPGMVKMPRAAASARDRASPQPIAVRDGGSTPIVPVP